MPLNPDFYAEAVELFEYTRALRRDFHQHPELGFQEVRTAGVVQRELHALGLETTAGVGKTGVVSLLEGGQPGPVVMLRFDMDALPICEETGAEYASQNAGVMHACGHDGHTAVGLTVARLLQAHREDLPGTIKLVFQPAEEGLGGAEGMIADGVLDNPAPVAALGLHLWNEKPCGWIGVTVGPSMAAGDIFKVTVRGKGGHGAVPHLAVDPVVAAAQVITALQSVVSRNVAPLDTAVISVTKVHGGEAFNVIPPQVELEGTIRTFKPEVRQKVHSRFREVIEGVAGALGCQTEIDLKRLTPAVINAPNVAKIVDEAARAMFPAAMVEPEMTMGSEDMAFFLEQVPGCFFFVGSANLAKGLTAAHHHPRFDIDEDALPRAAALLAAAAWRLAGSPPG